MGPGLRRDDIFWVRRVCNSSPPPQLMRHLRHTKIALLVFGLGMIAGLVVVAGEFSAWQRPAAGVMALGLVLIPVGLFADGHGMALVRWLVARLSRRRRPKPRGKRRTGRPAGARRQRDRRRPAGTPARGRRS